MDTITLIDIIEKEFGDTFDFHPEFFREFVELTEKSGSQAKIIKQFVQRLYAIIELGNIDFGQKWLEKLKAYENMYSLHLNADSKNYRLLFSKNKKGKYFLRMFYEKSGKNATSYAPNVAIAISRRNDNNKGDVYDYYKKRNV